MKYGVKNRDYMGLKCLQLSQFKLMATLLCFAYSENNENYNN